MFDFDRFAQDIAAAYQTHVVAAGKEAQAVILASFLLTFLIVRFMTHSIRAGRFRFLFHNISTRGGTHVHHLVPGILLLLTSGYIGIGVAPTDHRSWQAVAFGVGAALTLDEFALWLNLKDVYWQRQGRASIDAVVVAATISALGILGWSLWADLGAALWRLAGRL
jgi:hypothetical protein